LRNSWGEPLFTLFTKLLNRYWNNNVLRVDLHELEKIAQALGVEPGELIGPDHPAS